MGTSTQMANTTQIRNMVKSMIRAKQEIKRYSLNPAIDTIVTTGAIVPLNQGLLIGDTNQSRTGDIVFPISLELVYDIISGAAPVPSIVRVIVFQDRLNTGVAPTVAQVLDGAFFNSTYTVTPAQQKRFNILHDKSYEIAIGVHLAYQRKLSLKLKGKIAFNGDTNVVGANGFNSLWILYICSPNGAGSSATIDYYSSLLFTDD